MILRTLVVHLIAILFLIHPIAGISADDIVVVGNRVTKCIDDSGCFNRLHSAIPMTAHAAPGQTIEFRTRDAADVFGPVDVQAESTPERLRFNQGHIHPMTGPVYIEGAVAGDVIAMTIDRIEPGRYGFSLVAPFGFAVDLMDNKANFANELINGQDLVIWDLNTNFATTDAIAGIRIPNNSFPGIVTTLPGPKQLNEILERELSLSEKGGSVSLPNSIGAVPDDLCGKEGSEKIRCLRTAPPREHGGNLDIRYLQTGVTVYLPCNVDGCGLAIGDMHYAQGDGEVSGTAIEMSADIWVTTEVLKNGPDLKYGPHYQGPSHMLDIPSQTFYAVTGIPVKQIGTTPPDMAYLDSENVAGLKNLSKDINLAARNALDGIVDHIVSTYGYERWQAYIIASVAVDLRIGQVVDAPNVNVTAILPLDIFEAQP